MAGLNAALAAQLAKAAETRGQGNNKKFPPKPTYIYRPFTEVAFARNSGNFKYDIKTPSGAKVTKLYPKLKGVIVDASFNNIAQDWNAAEKKFVTHCQSSQHDTIDENGEAVKGNGRWMVPFFNPSEVFDAYEPTGTRMFDYPVLDEAGEETGEVEALPLKCRDCVAMKLNVFNEDAEQPTFCKISQGYVYVYLTHYFDPEQEVYVPLGEKEMLVSFRWGRNPDAWNRYLTKLNTEYGQNYNEVLTEFSLQGPNKIQMYSPVLAVDYPEEGSADEVTLRARMAYQTAVDEYEAKKAERAAERKAERDAQKAAGGGTVTNIADKRPAAAPAKATPKAAPKAAPKPPVAAVKPKAAVVDAPEGDGEDDLF